MIRLAISVLVAMFLLFLGCGSPHENGFVVLDGPVLESINKDGNLEFNGAVINSGDTPVTSIYVVLILKDDKGRVIEATSAPVLGEDPGAVLYPSERAFFTITTKADPAKVVSKEVEIYYEEAGQPGLPSS
ncbi:hypothetical protein HRbin37_01560 [bacterium HR37]|nr:hypothetical protein HRbin37_01560 [bacterium HR37]